MTEFQLKRLEYLIKQAEAGSFVQLGKGDAELLEELEKLIQLSLDNLG